MKTSLFIGATLAVLGLAAAPLIAQTQTSTTTSSSYIQTSKIIGTKVKTTQGEEIGVVKDVVIDRTTGCMAYTVLSAGGTGTRITGQAKLVSVPWAVYSTTSEPSVLMVTVDRDRIYNAPVFDYARINEYSTTGYINNVYSYYGVSAQAGVSRQTSVTGTATTTTGATTATGTTTTAATGTPMATASPMGTAAGAYGASPAATASASATASAVASPSASVAASPRATAAPRGTRGAGREETTTGRSRTGMSPAGSPSEETTTGKAKTGMSPAASPRHRGEGMREKAEESPAETAASPSGERKKARRHGAEGTAEPSGTPRTTEEQE